MKHISSTKQCLLAALFVWALVATGCIKEELDACYKLRLKVEKNGNDITSSGYVSNASLYIFDENLNHLETRQLDKDFIVSRRVIELPYPENRKLKIVAWGNETNGRQEVSEAQRIEELKVMLKSQNGLAQTPDSLYYGNKQVVTKAGGIADADAEIVIRPKVGTFMVQTIGLEYKLRSMGLKAAGELDYNMDRTLSGFDYQGKLIGDSVYYVPRSAWNASGKEWITPVEETMCAGENLMVTLNMAGMPLATATEAEDTETHIWGPIVCREGKLTEVVLRFAEDGSLSARMRITPWGAVRDSIKF